MIKGVFLLFLLNIGCSKQNPQQSSLGTNLMVFEGLEDQVLPIDYRSQQKDVEIEISTNPKHGTLSDCHTISKQEFKCIYTPKLNFYGTDTFTVSKISLEHNTKSNEIITLKINPVGDEPVANDMEISIQANAKRVFLAPPANDLDTVQNDIEYKVIQAPKHGYINDECFLGLNNQSKRQCEYIPDENFTGSDEIKYQVVDETNGHSKIATIKINVDNTRNIAGEK